MTKNELAIDADGEPFAVPAEVTGWRVRRVEGRGRPELAYDRMGRPVVVPVDATFTDLYRAAGPGRYRLDPIDATGHACSDVPVACTGTLQPEPSDALRNAPATPIERMAVENTQVRPFTGYDDVLCETIRANTRLAELVVSRIPAVLTAAGELITAADGASLTTRQPPAPLPGPDPEHEPEDLSEAPVPAVPVWMTALIQQAVSAVVPMIVAKLPGLPLGALIDWSKATPTPPQGATPPSAPASASGAPMPSAPTPVRSTSTPVPSTPTPTAPSTTPPGARATTPGALVSTGAPSAQATGSALATTDAPSEQAPADESTSSVDDSAAASAHILQIWEALTLAERARAQQLAIILTPDERTAWIRDLADRSVPDAVARIRELIRPHASPPSEGAQNGGTP